LLSGLVLDTLSEGQADGSPDSAQAGLLLHEVRGAAWTRTEAVGQGPKYRAEFGGKMGSALLLAGALAYESVVAGST
jgi:hypothetical protein